MYTSINSNGRLIKSVEARRLKELGLDSALISLHGDSRKVHEEAVNCEGAFEQGVSGIENLVKEEINVTVNYVSTQKNVERIIPTAEMLKEKGVRKMTATPLLPFPGVQDHKQLAMGKEQFRQYFDALLYAKEVGLEIDSTLPIAPCILIDMFPQDYRKYLEILSPRVCMAGVTFNVFSPEGVNRACIQAPELKDYGSDVKEHFEGAWEKAHKWSELKLIPEECLEQCYALPVCGGGCRTSSLATNGSVEGRTMYMGHPISQEDSRVLIARSEVHLDDRVRAFRKRNNIKLRRENFGSVLANTLRQSFVLLDRDGDTAYRSMPNEFKVVERSKGVGVLYAAGVLEPTNNNGLPEYKDNVSTVHASRLFPRLASNLPSDDKVRMLRADTGERIYF
jgi:radical SAM protein with 4Fe4S-binding SPASM domain